jgi:hypothetical protein
MTPFLDDDDLNFFLYNLISKYLICVFISSSSSSVVVSFFVSFSVRPNKN